MMANKVKSIPEGYHTVTPMLTVKNAAAVIDFYKKAFGAEERYRMQAPDGDAVVHAELKIGNSVIMLGEEMPGQECRSSVFRGNTSLFLCVR
jgi:PhnB protein